MRRRRSSRRRTREARRHRRYRLRLYVTGTTGKSIRAIQNVRRICEAHLHDDYELEVVDLYTNQQLARSDQIVAAPTLVKILPVPLRRLLGDMSDEQRVLAGLGLDPSTATGALE